MDGDAAQPGVLLRAGMWFRSFACIDAIWSRVTQHYLVSNLCFMLTLVMVTLGVTSQQTLTAFDAPAPAASNTTAAGCLSGIIGRSGFDGSLPTVVVAYQEKPSQHYQPVTHFGEGDGLLFVDSMSDVGTCIFQLGGAWSQRILHRGKAKSPPSGSGAADKTTSNSTSAGAAPQSSGKVDGGVQKPQSKKKAKKRARASANKAKKLLASSTGPSDVEKASQAKEAAEKAAVEAKKAAEIAEQERAAATEKWQEVGGGKKKSPSGISSASPVSVMPITEVMLFSAIKGVTPAADALKNRVAMALSRKVNPGVIMRALHSHGEFCVLGECCNVKASNCMRKHESNPVSLETVAQGHKQLLQKVQLMETKLNDATPIAQQQVISRTWSNVVSPWTSPTPPPVLLQPTTTAASAAIPAMSNTRDPLVVLRELISGGLMDRSLAIPLA